MRYFVLDQDSKFADTHIEGKSEPCSLTLGGYDANRFIPHNISFELSPTQQPEAFINSISVASGSPAGRVQNWSSNPLQLVGPAEGVSVVIDSSTPFLWLPESICESFALALGLTYNDSLALYTFDGNATSRDDLHAWNLNFTFSLSDTSSSSGVVNITLPYAAFDQQLSYPFIPNTTFETGDKYYFPLRQAANDTQYTIGRAFLQEAYIITDYERNNFSVYQVFHPADPLGNTSIVDITRPSNSLFTGVPGQTTSGGLSRTSIILISVGAVLFLILLIFAFFVYRRWRRKRIISEDESEPVTAPMAPKEPGGPPMIYGKDRISSTTPVEVSADTEQFELAVSQHPVELDGTSASIYDQPRGRSTQWNSDSVSDSSPDTVPNERYRASRTGIYSPVSPPGQSTLGRSPISSPPPMYRPATARAEPLHGTMRLRDNFDEPNNKFRSDEMRRCRMGEAADNVK